MEERKEYKGFAYIKGNNKPYILYGSSEEFIISRLQNFNKARTPELQYLTVNIGTLVDQKERADVRYDNYKKYEVATGRDISPVYLELPALPRDEFKLLTERIKAEGAKYNPHKKSWYVLQEDKERFKNYIPSPNKETTEVIDIKKELQEAMQEIEESVDQQGPAFEDKYSIDGIDVQYIVTLGDKRQVALSAGDIPEEYKNKTLREFLHGVDKALDSVLSQQEQVVGVDKTDQGEYILDVSRDIEINECTVYFSDGRDPMTLYGDQFGVSFASLSKEAASELVDNYLLNQADPYQIEDQLEYVPGRPITAYAINPANQQFYKLEGRVFDHNDTEVMLRFSEDKICDNIPQEYMQYEKDTLFSAAQKKWIEDVIKLNVPTADYKFMCNSTYTSAQLEAIAESFKDGLRSEQIEAFANLQIPSWKMDLYRIGMQHGISVEQMQDITSTTQDWVSGREQLTTAVKEHRKELSLNITKAGFKPTPEIVRKLEHMNHLTRRENTVKDVCAAFKQQTYREDPKLDQLVKDLGREFQMQEMAMKHVPIQ